MLFNKQNTDTLPFTGSVDWKYDLGPGIVKGRSIDHSKGRIIFGY